MSSKLLASSLAVTLLALAPAALANTCQAEHRTCSTRMPVGGYCECFSHGQTDSGTVVERVMARHGSHRSSVADCTADPSAPGCS